MKTLDQALIETAEFLEDHANTLDRWVEQSRAGGWSTHQVEVNRSAANECRREAARARSLVARITAEPLIPVDIAERVRAGVDSLHQS